MDTADVSLKKQADINALFEQNEQLRKASKAKSEFLSRMSHELRTPFTAVMGFGELLMLSELDDEQQEMVSAMMKAAKHLLDMLDDILDISRIEAGQLSILMESIPVKDLVNDAVELIRPLASTYRIEVEEDVDEVQHRHVAADRQRLRQVLINLLSNAVKYNRIGGRVFVRAHADDDDNVHIDITDTGIGIPEEKLSRLFVPFDRLDANERGIEGTGLGLALSRQLAESMNAKLQVTSQVGSGSTFSIVIPIVEPNALQEMRNKYDEIVDVREYTNTRNVLYVEDTVANMQLVERILLRRPDVKLSAASTGNEAIATATEKRPDLILLDLHLPDMHGREVLEELRRRDQTRDIPVVILSADSTQHQKDEMLEAGASTYLTKPVSVKSLLEAVDTCLETTIGL